MKQIMAIFWVVILTCMLHVNAEEVATSGKCGENATWSYADGVLTISGSGEMEEYSYTSLRPWNGCGKIKKVIIDEGITRLGSNTFGYYVALTEVDLPESLTSIGHDAFDSCTSLTDIELPEHLESIGSSAFENCSSLTEIRLPEGLTDIGFSAFEDCSTLSEIILPDSLTKINDSVFRDCKSLVKIKLPQNLISIGNNAFSGCTALSEINLPEGLETIYHGAFRNCKSLTRIKILSNIKEIREETFFGCDLLREVELPNGIESINRNAFLGCKSLISIDIPNSITDIGNSAFFGCTSLTSIEMPQNITEISEYTFYNCSSLKELVIPENVTVIEEAAFYGCENLTVYMHPRITYIGDDVFKKANAIVYARPESYAYGYAVEAGCEVRDYYLPNVGDVVDEIIDSDIYVTMNGELIPSYCVDGRTLILIRDLERYGFDVSFDEQNKIAYVAYNPDKKSYEGVATKLFDRNVLYTDIRAIVNGIEVEVRNTNGFIAVEAERLGNYVPEISCVWQPEHRRLQMQAFEGMASFEDMVNSISERKGIAYTQGCRKFADTNNGRFDSFVDKGYIWDADYNGYIYPMRGLTMHQFLAVAGRVYFGGNHTIRTGVAEINDKYVPNYLTSHVKKMYEKGIIVPDENGYIYFDGVLTKAQMEYYLDILDQG